jgi:LytS/YehU family sensor histidine kinase
MITQIYAENAIKHGLKPLKEGGMIIIRALHENHDLILEIEDNGVGRKAAPSNGEIGTGKGIPMMEQTISIINKFNPKDIRITITDLEDEQGHPLGTKVIILLPKDMNYRFYSERG